MVIVLDNVINIVNSPDLLAWNEKIVFFCSCTYFVKNGCGI